jgi:hypothetical protein
MRCERVSLALLARRNLRSALEGYVLAASRHDYELLSFCVTELPRLRDGLLRTFIALKQGLLQ